MLESKVVAEQDLADTIQSIQDGKTNMAMATEHLANAEETFQQTRFDANAMLNQIESQPVTVKSAPVATPMESSTPTKELSSAMTDNVFLQVARDHVNNYSSGTDLKTTVQDLKFLCRSGVEDLKTKF